MEILPLALVAFVCAYAYLKKVPIFSSFTNGAKKSFSTTLSILPSLIGLITAISMLSASGALEAFSNIMKPIAEKINFPSEILPLALLRPISGSGSNAIVINLFENFGADSQIGNIASVLSASSETSLYAISIYLGAKSYKSLKYTIPVALIGDFCTVILSVLFTAILIPS